MVQLIWNIFLIYMDYGTWAWVNLPLFAGILLLLIGGKMENASIQNWSRVIFAIAITKALVVIGLFVYSIIELVELDEKDSNYASKYLYWEYEGMLTGAFTIVDLIVAYICLLIIRRTTQYANLLKRKEFFEFRNSLETTMDSE